MLGVIGEAGAGDEVEVFEDGVEAFGEAGFVIRGVRRIWRNELAGLGPLRSPSGMNPLAARGVFLRVFQTSNLVESQVMGCMCSRARFAAQREQAPSPQWLH